MEMVQLCLDLELRNSIISFMFGWGSLPTSVNNFREDS